VAIDRSDVAEKWAALVDGHLSRESVASWAEGVEIEEPNVMVEIGLQFLTGVNQRSQQRSPDGSSHLFDDYTHSIERLAKWLGEWRAACAAFDADPAGTVFLCEEREDDEDDFRISHWTGMFSGLWQGARLCLNSPAQLSVNEAIAWGRARASRVLVRTRDDISYSAGAGYEWLDRTEADDVISWDVTTAPYSPPLTDSDEFLQQFASALREAPDVALVSIQRGPGSSDRPGPPTAVVRVQARTEPEAQKVAMAMIRPPFAKAVRRVGHTDPFGWTMGADARPTGVGLPG
jgi:hypothetical protein